MKMHKLSPVAIAAAIVAAALAQPANARPNFSGEWKLNPEKSDFGPMPGPGLMTLKIQHNEPNLLVVNIQHRTEGDLEYEAKYTTDGRECSNRVGDIEAKSTVTWDGDVLNSTTRFDAGGKTVTITSRWTLSENGRTLTTASHFATAQGEFDTVQVFEKQ